LNPGGKLQNETNLGLFFETPFQMREHRMCKWKEERLVDGDGVCDDGFRC